MDLGIGLSNKCPGEAAAAGWGHAESHCAASGSCSRVATASVVGMLLKDFLLTGFPLRGPSWKMDLVPRQGDAERMVNNYDTAVLRDTVSSVTWLPGSSEPRLWPKSGR